MERQGIAFRWRLWKSPFANSQPLAVDRVESSSLLARIQQRGTDLFGSSSHFLQSSPHPSRKARRKLQIVLGYGFWGKIEVLLDHHCLPFYLDISGLVPPFLSVVCKFSHLSPTQGQLLVSFAVEKHDKAEFLPLNGFDGGKVSIPWKEESFKIKVHGKVPQKIYTFKTALGFGPYRFFLPRE